MYYYTRCYCFLLGFVMSMCVNIYCLGREALNYFTRCSVPILQKLFYTTLLKNCGTGEGLYIATCPESVVGGKQGHAHCQILFTPIFPLLSLSKITGESEDCHKVVVHPTTISFWDKRSCCNHLVTKGPLVCKMRAFLFSKKPPFS